MATPSGTSVIVVYRSSGRAISRTASGAASRTIGRASRSELEPIRSINPVAVRASNTPGRTITCAFGSGMLTVLRTTTCTVRFAFGAASWTFCTEGPFTSSMDIALPVPVSPVTVVITRRVPRGTPSSENAPFAATGALMP